MLVSTVLTARSCSGIALLSIAFDIVFILQHYVLYRHSTDGIIFAGRDTSSDEEDEASDAPQSRTGTDGERRPLLA